MSISKIEKDFTEKPKMSVLKYGIIALAIIVSLAVVGSVFGMFGKVVSAPGRVISKTLETNNIVQSYEWFYDVNASYTARASQVQEFIGLQSEATSDSDKSKLRTELSAMKQSCRDLVTKYNANSEKMNKSIFKGWSLPDRLDIATCEGKSE